MRDVDFHIPPPVSDFLRRTIREAGGNEVFFLGKVSWPGERTASLSEVDVLARGHSAAVPAILQDAEKWDVAIHNHPGGDLTPSDADLHIAAELGNKSVGFVIISNDADRHNVVVNPFRRHQKQPLDLEQIRWIFGPGGALEASLEGFESRPGQVEMALEVARALNEEKTVACEAGTGVGKSFAYLIPSILWAATNRDRVLVSTGTINLQEQLVRKDLPFLAELMKKILPQPFHYALIKGRGNYACRRKLEELPHEFDLLLGDEDPRERQALEHIIEWARATRDGSLAELGWMPPAGTWERVMSETDKSLKVKCKHYQDCFFYNAKRRASGAQVVVANHHLFFADLAVRRQLGDYDINLILPPYARVVFDEAHHLEDVASDHFGVTFTRAGFKQRLGRMVSSDGRRGALVYLHKRLASLQDSVAAEAIQQRYSVFVPEVAQRIDSIFAEVQELFDEWRLTGAFGESGGEGEETMSKVRFRPDVAAAFWEEVRERLGRLRKELEELGRLNDDGRGILDRARIRNDDRDRLLLELDSFANRLADFAVDLERFCSFDDPSLVRWMSAQESGDSGGRGGKTLSFAAAPVRVAEVLRTALYEPMKTVVLTSATLSVAGNSRFLGDRLGFSLLGSDAFRFRELPSPFDFESQVLLAVPTDVPAPVDPRYQERLPGLVYDLVRISSGRAFVLFTSYSLLRRVHARLREPLARLGLSPLAQGEAQRSELLRRFQAGPGCVLFGTDSFWEGVDVKGRALEQVILTRLPFRVPTEPLQEARLEEVAERGENPFTAYTVPQAVLKFKQGFGRLIRSTSDRGVVAVLDQRILTRHYGKVFLASLPPTRLCRASTAVVLRRVEEFFAEFRVTEAQEAPPPWS